METGIVITLIICGTIVAVVAMGLAFTIWVITVGLKVAKENKLTLVVFNINVPGNLKRVVCGEAVGSKVVELSR